jgi:RNA polymerase sigma-70 factor, ECF subfamily
MTTAARTSAPDRERAASDRHVPAAELSEVDLVVRARSSDEGAIRELIRRNNRLLFRLARGLVSDDTEAEDIVQETYVRGFTRLESFRGGAAFSTWLARIAINEALGRIRKSRRYIFSDDLKEYEKYSEDAVVTFPMNSHMPDPESETVRRQIREMLTAAVDRLPEGFRIVFILRDIEGVSTEAVGEHLALRPETVRSRLHRARRLLRADIEKAISSGFADLFPFAGKRCANLADRVVESILFGKK